MPKPLKWLTGPIRGARQRRRRQQQDEEFTALKKRFSEIALEAADAAVDRNERKEDYGSMVEQVAELAQERMDIRSNKAEIVLQAADVVLERTTSRQTMFHLLKGNIGPGCLSLPWCFSQLGIPLGIVLTLLIGLWTYYNILTVLHVKRTHTSNRRTITYSDLGEVAFHKSFRTFTTFSIVLLQLAVCTVYLSFVGNNLQSFFQAFLPSGTVPLLANNAAYSILLVVPIVAFITLMPNLRALGPISEIAMLILFGAFIFLGVVLFENYDPTTPFVTAPNWSQVPIAVCGILYSFECICIVLPLEASMKDRTNFSNLFTYAYLIVTLVYCMIGGICVFVLGQVSNGSITSFLMSHSSHANEQTYILVTISNLLASVAVLLTYALTMFPCIELWCQAMQREERPEHEMEPDNEVEDWWGGELAYGPHDTPILRLSLVGATVLVAAAVPNVTQLIGLAGAIAGASTALIIPPLLAIHFTSNNWKKVFEYMLLTIGLVFGVIGATASIYDIYSSFVVGRRTGGE